MDATDGFLERQRYVMAYFFYQLKHLKLINHAEYTERIEKTWVKTLTRWRETGEP